MIHAVPPVPAPEWRPAGYAEALDAYLNSVAGEPVIAGIVALAVRQPGALTGEPAA